MPIGILGITGLLQLRLEDLFLSSSYLCFMRWRRVLSAIFLPNFEQFSSWSFKRATWTDADTAVPFWPKDDGLRTVAAGSDVAGTSMRVVLPETVDNDVITEEGNWLETTLSTTFCWDLPTFLNDSLSQGNLYPLFFDCFSHMTICTCEAGIIGRESEYLQTQFLRSSHSIQKSATKERRFLLQESLEAQPNEIQTYKNAVSFPVLKLQTFQLFRKQHNSITYKYISIQVPIGSSPNT